MNKYYIILIICILQGIHALAQVGVNTNSTTGSFEVQGGTSGAQAEKVIVSKTGNVGIGMMPDTKLSINGHLNYPVNNFGLNRVLQSDDSGNASWIKFGFLQMVGIWNIESTGNGIVFQSNIYTQLTGNSTISPNDQIGLVATTNGVTIPSGTYLATVTGELLGEEWGFLKLQTADGSEVYLENHYVTYHSGNTALLRLTTPTTLTLSFRPDNPNIVTTTGSLFFLNAPYQAPYTFSVGFYMLSTI